MQFQVLLCVMPVSLAWSLKCCITGDAELQTDDGEYAWLEERKKPDEFIVVGANYSGPKIMDQWFGFDDVAFLLPERTML